MARPRLHCVATVCSFTAAQLGPHGRQPRAIVLQVSRARPHRGASSPFTARGSDLRAAAVSPCLLYTRARDRTAAPACFYCRVAQLHGLRPCAIFTMCGMLSTAPRRHPALYCRAAPPSHRLRPCAHFIFGTPATAPRHQSCFALPHSSSLAGCDRALSLTLLRARDRAPRRQLAFAAAQLSPHELQPCALFYYMRRARNRNAVSACPSLCAAQPSRAAAVRSLTRRSAFAGHRRALNLLPWLSSRRSAAQVRR